MIAPTSALTAFPTRLPGLARLGLLWLLALLLLSLDWLGLQFSPQLITAPLPLALAALLYAGVMAWWARSSHWAGWPLVGVLFLAFWSLNTLLVAVEAMYLSDLLPLPLALRLLGNGLVTSGLLALGSAWLFGRFPGRAAAHNVQLRRSAWWAWPLRLALAGLLWTVLFVLTGLLVFRPLATFLAPVEAAAYLASFAHTDGGAVLLFQVLRGALWAALSLPLIAALPGGRARTGLLLAALYAVAMGANMLLPAGLLPAIQVAHLVEVSVENFAFGWVVAWLFAKR